MIEKTTHIPVLLKEIIERVDIRENMVFVDATLGGGGHLFEVIRKCEENDCKAKFIAFDQDHDAVVRFEQKALDLGYTKTEDNKFKKDKIEIIVIEENFRKIDLVSNLGIGSIDYILADLGFSTDQLVDLSRGFSFKSKEKIDLRMNQSISVTGANLLNALYKKELIDIFRKYADLKEANRIANKIIDFRKTKLIETFKDLNQILEQVVGFNNTRMIKSRVIQALRIVVNDELGSLEEMLPKAYKMLATNGKMMIISFHSGEDRIVKRFFKARELNNDGSSELIIPTAQEVNSNSKSSSAKLRVFEKK